MGKNTENYIGSSQYLEKKNKYIEKNGDETIYLIKIYKSSDCNPDKTELIRGRFIGPVYGWINEDTGNYIGNEHPRSKYSTPIEIMTQEEYKIYLVGGKEELDKQRYTKLIEMMEYLTLRVDGVLSFMEGDRGVRAVYSIPKMDITYQLYAPSHYLAVWKVYTKWKEKNDEMDIK